MISHNSWLIFQSCFKWCYLENAGFREFVFIIDLLLNFIYWFIIWGFFFLSQDVEPESTLHLIATSEGIHPSSGLANGPGMFLFHLLGNLCSSVVGLWYPQDGYWQPLIVLEGMSDWVQFPFTNHTKILHGTGKLTFLFWEFFGLT